MNHRKRQQGLVLVLALIVLAAMSLAAIGLMRGVLGSNRVAANLAFQQAAVQAADVGVETAIAWLEQKSRETNAPAAAGGAVLPANKLFNNITKTANGEAYNYVATRDDPVNQTWESFWAARAAVGQVNTLSTDAAGNTVAFMIHRLCALEGDPLGSGCESAPQLPASVQNSSKSSALKLKQAGQVYYRITVRVQGPRNANSFIQAIVAI